MLRRRVLTSEGKKGRCNYGGDLRFWREECRKEGTEMVSDTGEFKEKKGWMKLGCYWGRKCLKIQKYWREVRPAKMSRRLRIRWALKHGFGLGPRFYI